MKKIILAVLASSMFAVAAQAGVTVMKSGEALGQGGENLASMIVVTCDTKEIGTLDQHLSKPSTRVINLSSGESATIKGYAAQEIFHCGISLRQ